MKVTTVIRLAAAAAARSETEEGPQDQKLFVAFTTKDPMLNDNFDFVPGRTVPVENCTFGAAKVFVERCEIHGFCHDPIALPDAYVCSLVSKFEGVPETERERLLGVLASDSESASMSEENRMDARRTFMKEVLRTRIDATDKAVLDLAQKKGITREEDALVKACVSRTKDMEALVARAASTTATPAEIVALYCNARTMLLPHVALTNPRLSKMALGRQVLFPLMQEVWSSPNVDLAAWSVFFVRRFLLASHPDLAYMFCLLHRFGLSCEVSDCDDLWAKKVAAPADKSAGALCFVLETEASETLDAIEAAAPSRKLGVVNRRVAFALLGLQAEDSEEEGAMIRMMGGTALFAEAYLTRCGWTSWFNTRIVPLVGDGGGSPVVCGGAFLFAATLVLPEPMRAAILGATLDDVAETLRALAAALG